MYCSCKKRLKQRKAHSYFVSIDSHPASSSSAHFSSSKVIKLGAGADACLDFDEFVFPVFFEGVDRPEVVDDFEVGFSSFNHDSKLRSRSGFDTSLFDLDCC